MDKSVRIEKPALQVKKSGQKTTTKPIHILSHNIKQGQKKLRKKPPAPSFTDKLKRFLLSPTAKKPFLTGKTITINPRWDIVRDKLAVVSWHYYSEPISALSFRSGLVTLTTTLNRYLAFSHNDLPRLPVTLDKLKKTLLHDYKRGDFDDLGTIYKKILSHMPQYVYFCDEVDYHIVTSFIIMTYFYQCFDAVPYLHIYSPKGSGKSTLLRYISCFSKYASIHTKITPAAAGHLIDTRKQTMLWDQAEYLSSNSTDTIAGELMPYLTASYSKDSGKRIVIDTTKSGTRTTYEVDFYCPKAFASYREIYYDLQDRCIVIRMEKTTNQIKNIYEIDPREKTELTYTLTWYYLANWVKVKDEYVRIRKMLRYQNSRVVELFSPLSAIMRIAGVDNVDAIENEILQRISKGQTIMSNKQFAILTTLQRLTTMFNSNKIATKTIIDSLARENITVTHRYLSDQISLFKVGDGPKTIHLPNNKKGKGYLIDIERLSNLLSSIYCIQEPNTCNFYDCEGENECTLLFDYCPYARSEVRNQG